MKRQLSRVLLALAAGFFLMPVDALAQSSAKVYRIGVLDMAPPDLSSPNQRAFSDELRRRGYVEGQNLTVERRNATGQPDRLPALARELVALQPDLIVAAGPQPNRAVKDATSTIPIVMIAVGDPVQAGLVTNLARPGGNLTGVAAVVPGGIMAKSLDLLHQAAPKATRVGMLVNPTNAMHRILVPQEIPEAARKLGVQIVTVEARTADEIEPAIITPRSANEPRPCSSKGIPCGKARLSGFRKSWRAPASRRSTFRARKRRRVGSCRSDQTPWCCRCAPPATSIASSKVPDPATWRSSSRRRSIWSSISRQQRLSAIRLLWVEAV